jgi:hypothetical protein
MIALNATVPNQDRSTISAWRHNVSRIDPDGFSGPSGILDTIGTLLLNLLR